MCKTIMKLVLADQGMCKYKKNVGQCWYFCFVLYKETKDNSCEQKLSFCRIMFVFSCFVFNEKCHVVISLLLVSQHLSKLSDESNDCCLCNIDNEKALNNK